ncbi:RNA-binding protein 42 [Mortierella hygrophila]|uniref:RNA-binding protein 42 n=1 Tax=Mortierella hygrophila TaxID=979708 RepID=A0A9P6F2B6_9FUNG|nr:RNA-binding protein 42 [Mortierella hygrophila]
MAYNQHHGAAVPQYTPEEIAYWASMGYVMDPSYVAPAPVAPAYPQYPQQQQYQPYGVTGPSIVGAGRGGYAVGGGRHGGGGGAGPGAGGYHGHIGSRGPVAGTGAGFNHSYNQPYGIPGAVEEPPVSEYEDLNKLFVDPKKAQEEAEAVAAALAEEEDKAAKAKAAATVVRKAAGKTWEDSTLLEFEENDFRLFAGDLGNEVTDEILTKTFSKYPSFLMAKVVRDKRTDKSRGYGFISFAEPDGFARAWKEMNGKYVGNRPIKLRKSQWKDRTVEIVREPKAPRGPYDPEAFTKKERAKPYKVKKLNNAGK